MSMPRAARSVATSTCTREALKSASTWVRAPWLSSPWKGSASTPARRSLSATISARVLGGDEHQHARPAAALDQLAQQLGAPAGVDLDRALLDGRRAPPAGSACDLDAHRIAQQARRPATGPPAGRWPRTAGSGAAPAAAPGCGPAPRRSRGRTGGRPRRAPASATDDSRSARWSIRSSRRPGVATTMSAPPRSAIICGLIETPPKATAMLDRQPAGAAPGCACDSPTCAASSRVGTRTSACSRRGGWRGRAREPLQQGQRECGRLAGAGLGGAQQVAPLQDRREWPPAGSPWARGSPCRWRRAPGKDRVPANGMA